MLFRIGTVLALLAASSNAFTSTPSCKLNVSLQFKKIFVPVFTGSFPSFWLVKSSGFLKFPSTRCEPIAEGNPVLVSSLRYRVFSPNGRPLVLGFAYVCMDDEANFGAVDCLLQKPGLLTLSRAYLHGSTVVVGLLLALALLWHLRLGNGAPPPVIRSCSGEKRAVS